MALDDIGAQDRIYARSLTAFDPVVVGAACDEIGKTKAFFPELSVLLSACREHERLIEMGRARRIANPIVDVRRSTPPLTDRQRLAMWRKNDDLADDMARRPHAYLCGPALLSFHQKFEAIRAVEFPALAAQYYDQGTSP
jgi:hypothetical protein